MFGLVILIVLIVAIAGGLILASNYVASIGELLNMIWNFIVSNMFGFLILLCCILFVIYLFKKINFEKINIRPNYDRKLQKLDYRSKKSGYKRTKSGLKENDNLQKQLNFEYNLKHFEGNKKKRGKR